MAWNVEITEQTMITQKPVVYVIAFTAALAGLLFGLDVGVISGALPLIAKEFGVGSGVQEAIVSALLWGATLGAVISGALSKRFGRKNTIIAASIIFALGSLGSAFSTSAGVLIGVRVFLGLAVGMASFTTPLYLSEMAPQEMRGALVSLYQLLITIGIVIAFISDAWFSTYASIHGVVGGHWRMMLGILVIPSMIMFLAVSFLPRSPRWLVLRGKKEEAALVLARLRNTSAEAARELEEIEEELSVPQSGFALFVNNRFFRRAVFLGIVLQAIQQLTGINVVMYYAPKIFQAAGFENMAEQMWGTVIVGCTNVMATFIAIALVDRVGRKPIMYAGFITMGLAMSTVGVLFNIGVESNHLISFASIAALLIFIIGFAMSAGPIIWIICSEIYPTSGRDLGITISTATNWIVNGIVGATFLTLLDRLGSGATFLLYGGLEVVFIVIFIFYVPETKGVSLEHIAGNLMAGKKLRDIGR